eukprot:1187871-Prorocentrum_minimum.AAC.3
MGIFVWCGPIRALPWEYSCPGQVRGHAAAPFVPRLTGTELGETYFAALREHDAAAAAEWKAREAGRAAGFRARRRIMREAGVILCTLDRLPTAVEELRQGRRGEEPEPPVEVHADDRILAVEELRQGRRREVHAGAMIKITRLSPSGAHGHSGRGLQRGGAVAVAGAGAAPAQSAAGGGPQAAPPLQPPQQRGRAPLQPTAALRSGEAYMNQYSRVRDLKA